MHGSYLGVKLRCVSRSVLMCCLPMTCGPSCRSGCSDPQLGRVISVNQLCTAEASLDVGATPALVGRVAERSVMVQRDGSATYFEIEPILRYRPVCTSQHRVRVHYQGVLPPLFGDGVEVFVTTRVSGPSEVVGVEMVTRCPGQYEAVKMDNQVVGLPE